MAAHSSEPSVSSLNSHLMSLLKVNDNGWNISLFHDKNVIRSSLCGNCKDVCRDAVELGCDHDDDDIILFCNSCLTDLISSNDNKCPINQHLDPIICPVRSVRRQILKTSVICPYSIEFKKRNKNINIDNEAVIDTFGCDQKEGIVADDVNIDGCEWNGTLNELLNSDHLRQCTIKYDVTFMQKLQIEKIQTENQSLRKIIEQQKQTIGEQSVIIKDLQNKNKTNKAQYVRTLQEKEGKIKELNALIQKQSIQLKVAQKQTIDEQSAIINEREKKLKRKEAEIDSFIEQQTRRRQKRLQLQQHLYGINTNLLTNQLQNNPRANQLQSPQQQQQQQLLKQQAMSSIWQQNKQEQYNQQWRTQQPGAVQYAQDFAPPQHQQDIQQPDAPQHHVHNPQYWGQNQWGHNQQNNWNQ